MNKAIQISVKKFYDSMIFNRHPEENELIKLRKEHKQLLMENDIFKASGADHRTKVNVIHQNRHKYSVSAMCKVLQVPRSSYYYKEVEKRIR